VPIALKNASLAAKRAARYYERASDFQYLSC
jgi:hypothetical protein